MNTDTDTKTDEAATKKENAKAARRRHYEKVKKCETLEKLAMTRIWDEFAQKEEPEASGMVHVDDTKNLVKCLLLALDIIHSNKWFSSLYRDVPRICRDWLYYKELWTGKYVSKLDVFDGKLQRKIVPETVLIKKYFQFDDGSDKDDPLYDGFSNMIHHLYDYDGERIRSYNKQYDVETRFVKLLIQDAIRTKMRSEESKTENTCKDITY